MLNIRLFLNQLYVFNSLKNSNRPDKKEVRGINKNNAKEDRPRPSWRFSTVDKDGPFAWNMNDEKRIEIIEKLHNFDSMTWQEIQGPDHHAIDINSLSKEAQDRLLKIKKDDIDNIFSFHINGGQRIICILVQNVAEILWYDPKHKVCLSKKKHT